MSIKNFSANIKNSITELQNKNYSITDSKKFTLSYLGAGVLILVILSNLSGGKSLNTKDPSLRFYDDGKTRIMDVGSNLRCTKFAMSSKHKDPLFLKESFLIPCDPKQGINCRLVGKNLRRCIFKK